MTWFDHPRAGRNPVTFTGPIRIPACAEMTALTVAAVMRFD
jgi:hypothetical protein